MDFIDSEEIDKLKHNFELEKFVSVFVKTLRALQSIHNAGIVHGDIKGDNILFSENEVKFIDFGLSESVVSEGNNKSDQVYEGVTYLGKGKQNRKTTQYFKKLCYENKKFIGTSRFASTFVHAGCSYFPRDDIWSLLFLFFEILVGNLPWSEINEIRRLNFKERTKNEIN